MGTESTVPLALLMSSHLDGKATQDDTGAINMTYDTLFTGKTQPCAAYVVPKRIMRWWGICGIMGALCPSVWMQ